MKPLAERLRESLARVATPSHKIIVEKSRGGVQAILVSDGFADLGEADRQKLVWDALLEDASLAEEDLVAIDFVFTVTRAEAVEHGFEDAVEPAAS